MVLVLLLGIADLIAAFLLVNPGVFVTIAFIFGVLHLIKGISSIIGGLLSGFFFEFMGAIDLLTGLCLLFTFEIPYLWIPLAIKGIYSVVTGL